MINNKFINEAINNIYVNTLNATLWLEIETNTFSSGDGHKDHCVTPPQTTVPCGHQCNVSINLQRIPLTCISSCVPIVKILSVFVTASNQYSCGGGSSLIFSGLGWA
jgi:hypothetical protein